MSVAGSVQFASIQLRVSRLFSSFLFSWNWTLLMLLLYVLDSFISHIINYRFFFLVLLWRWGFNTLSSTLFWLFFVINDCIRVLSKCLHHHIFLLFNLVILKDLPFLQDFHTLDILDGSKFLSVILVTAK
jgi:hypothetical protein